MKILRPATTLLLVFALILTPFAPPLPALAAPRAAMPVATATIPTWPRVIDRDGNHIIVYQPQLKSWRAYRSLIADTAISIQQGTNKPILGVISWHADTITDTVTRLVVIRN